MGFSNEFTLVNTMVKMGADRNGTYERLAQSMDALGEGLEKYFTLFGTPEEERDRLIGHRGLLGEGRNSIGLFFGSIIRPVLNKEQEEIHSKTLYSAFALSDKMNEHSFLARCEHTDETLDQAFDRITHDISVWLDTNRHLMAADDAQALRGMLGNVEKSLAEIKGFVQDAREYFDDHRGQYRKEDLMLAAHRRRAKTPYRIP